MKKRIVITAIAVILIAAIACILLLTPQEGSEGILYRVTGETGTAYLLGSIHIGTSAMHPFGDTLKAAMEASNVFVFECDTTSDASVAQLRSRQVLPEGISLKNILGGALYEDVAAAYTELGLSASSLGSRQPWAVINTLAVYSSAAEMGVRNVGRAISLGVEPTVRDYANGHDKSFAYLETVDEVANTMESFSDELTRYLLQDEADVILKRKSTAGMDTVALWPEWWHDGDTEAFRAFYSQSFQGVNRVLYAEYQDKLVTQRNILMAERLDAMLQDGGIYFVTVGLLHLISDDGSILSLLQEMGYLVDQVETAE